MPKKTSYQAGFTLLEILVSTGLSLTLLGAIYAVFRAQTHTVKGQESRMEAHEYALSVLDTIVREIRNTGYFPSGVACTNVANTNGVVSGGAQSFRLVYDADADGTCEEDVAFTYDSTNREVLRNGVPLTDGNATDIQFTYYPQQTGLGAPAPYCVATGVPSGCTGPLSANYSKVQRINIAITIQAKSSDTEFGGQSTITMSSSADLRNHGL